MNDSIKKEQGKLDCSAELERLCTQRNEVIVFHGGTEIVDHPDCKCGRRNLDFGRGLYLYGDLYIADEFMMEIQRTPQR